MFKRPNIDSEADTSILTDISREINADVLNEPITREEISSSILSLRGKCATGPDGLCIEMYKCTADVILPY